MLFHIKSVIDTDRENEWERERVKKKKKFFALPLTICARENVCVYL